MHYHFRQATSLEVPQIMVILQQAIQRRKEEGSTQWQDGYPNTAVVQRDIEKGEGYVLTQNEVIIGYTAVLINDEPEYEKIIGKWITTGNFVVFHRVAIAESFLGKGLAKMMLRYIEDFALSNHIYSIKADTNFDNLPMLSIFKNTGYTYCGEVYFRGSPRKAFEKVLTS